MRTRALRPDLHGAAVVDPRDRAAARSDRDDVDARPDDGTAADLRVGPLEDVPVLDERDVVARAADVGADHVRVAELPGQRTRTDHSAGRARLERPDRKLRSPRRVDDTAVRLHERERTRVASAAQALAELAEVRRERRLDVAVQHRRRRSFELAPLGRHLRRRGDGKIRMRGADALDGAALVGRVRVRVQEAHGNRLDAVPQEQLELAVDLVERERLELRSVRGRSLGHLAPEVARHQRLGRRVEEVVDLGARAAADREDVAEAARRQQPDPDAALLEHGVDRDRRPVEEAADLGWRDG